jgi:hypothetical protein
MKAWDMLREQFKPDGKGRFKTTDAMLVAKQLEKEVERLQKYEELVKFIADDYIELSYDKAQWQRNDWRKRCEKLVKSEYKNER